MSVGTGNNGRSGRNGAGGKVASVHVQGDRFVVLTGEASGGKVSVSARVVAESDWSATAELFESQGVSRVVFLVAGAGTIARAVMVPQADVGQMTEAASLLAEVQLPESIPSHRRGAGVLTGQGEASQVPALLVGWTASAGAMPALPEDIEQGWCPVIGALAALRGIGSESAWWADPGDGSISILSGTGQRTAARVVIEDNSSAVLWGEGLASTVGEELDDVSMKPRIGLSEAQVEALGARVNGLRVSKSFLDTNGPALGALMIALGMDPALSRLCELRAEAPKIEEPWAVRAATWLGDSGHAAWVIAASLILVLAMPIGIAWARVTMLDSKSQSLKKANETRKELDQRAAVYAELANSRWPMTKLLSDISQATPVGVVITDLRMEPSSTSAVGGDTQGITINGVAESQEKVYDLQTNLNKAGLFKSVQVKRSDTKADGGVTFNLIMGVQSPHGTIASNPDWDWSKNNLAIRKYGEGASIKEPPAAKPGSSPSESTRTTRRTTRTSSDDSSDGGSADKKPSGGVPPELTDAQIAKMDKVTAMKEFVARRTYPQKNPSLDAATKRRLEEEANKLRERSAALNAGGKP